ncbi:hypothetical protein EYZ11_003820 [Aspergillus tanneri]|uniref:Uncharacterized protein n=1 Tax=Aspergillus tanneri TaxID=1220188 RepID=A0A4V3UPW2_9EURO|nr:hypothetical protein EYZ11_003820 [Aspergillus tanneri]
MQVLLEAAATFFGAEKVPPGSILFCETSYFHSAGDVITGAKGLRLSEKEWSTKGIAPVGWLVAVGE